MVTSVIGNMEIEIPDLAEPIVAWRAWRVAPRRLTDGDNTIILSSVNGTMWPPNGTGKRPFHKADFVTARCTRQPALRPDDPPIGNEHPCPCSPAEAVGHAGSGCGIYAFKDLEGLALEFPLWGMSTSKATVMSEITVWGQVELWGHVYDHAKGYRAQHAKVKTLTHVPGYGLPETKLKEIGEIYGIEVEPVGEDIVKVLDSIRRRQEIINKLEPAAVAWYIVSALYQVGKEESTKWIKEKVIRRGRNR